jgi:hypothetical protein
MAELVRDLGGLVDVVQEYLPAENCTCGGLPPCRDCVDYGALREAVRSAEVTLNRCTDTVASREALRKEEQEAEELDRYRRQEISNRWRRGVCPQQRRTTPVARVVGYMPIVAMWRREALARRFAPYSRNELVKSYRETLQTLRSMAETVPLPGGPTTAEKTFAAGLRKERLE